MNENGAEPGGVTVLPAEAEHFAMAADPMFWASHAESLRWAALVLSAEEARQAEAVSHGVRMAEADPNYKWPASPPSVTSHAVMLCAFALENLFKALAIVDDRALVESNRIDRSLRGHDLVELAKLARVDLSPDEARYCELGSNAIRFAGRYPVPLRGEGMYSSISYGRRRGEVFEGLYQRLVAMIPERRGWTIQSSPPTSAT